MGNYVTKTIGAIVLIGSNIISGCSSYKSEIPMAVISDIGYKARYTDNFGGNYRKGHIEDDARDYIFPAGLPIAEGDTIYNVKGNEVRNGDFRVSSFRTRRKK